MNRLGIGFIAALAGFELTNIVVYMKLGALYGFTGFIALVAMILPLIYLQQVILIINHNNKEGLMGLIRSHRILLSFFYYSVVIASLFTLYANLIGISIILSLVYGSHWFYFSLALTSLTWLTINRTVIVQKMIKLLSYVSLILLIYVVLLILNIGVLIERTSIDTHISYFDLLALWGASAAPYSIVLQAIEKKDDYTSIYVGGLSTILIGSAIVSIGLIYLYPSNEFIIGDSLKPLFLLGTTALTIYIMGLLVIVFMTIISIILSIKLMNKELLGLNRLSEPPITHYLIIIGLVSTRIIEHLVLNNVSQEKLYTTIILTSSAMIGVFFTITLATITWIYFMLQKRFNNRIYFINTVYLVNMTIFSFILSILGLMDIL